MKRHAPNLAPRLLDKGQAAAYCGMCPAVFATSCTVQAIEIKPGFKRWDRHALDEWVDKFNNSLSGSSLVDRYDDRDERKSKRA